MKNLLPLLFFVFQFHLVNAQSNSAHELNDSNNVFSEDRSVKNEMGFDMFYFLNLFRQHYEVSQSTIFSVSYNRELNDKLVLRTNLGLGYTNLELKQDTSLELKTKIYEADLKIGLAWKTICYRRWQFYYGFDWEFQKGYNLEQIAGPSGFPQSITENINKILQSGPGPFLGLVFYLNPRISLSIETNLNFVYTSQSSQLRNSDHPELFSNSDIHGFTTTFTTPQNIYLNMKF